MKKYLIILLTFLSFYSFSQDIVEWRGPNRTGVYDETDLLEEWPKNGPKLLWSIENLYKGYSSVSVANEMVYFTGVNDTLDMLIAVDLNGYLKWQTPIGRSRVGSYPESRCTPTIENNKVYVSSGHGFVSCINALSGDIIWSVDARKEFDGVVGKWGIAESLLVVDDKVVYTAGGKKTNVIALNKITGEPVWTSISINQPPSYASPLLIEKGDLKLIVSVTPNSIIGVLPETGEVVWNFDNMPYATSTRKNQANTPLYHDGRIFVTNGYNHISVMLDLSDDLKSVSVAWTDTILDVHHGGVVLVDGYIYGANWINNGQGNWCCINWDTGKVQYETKWKTKGSIISADGKLYCYEEKTGFIALVNPNPEKFDIISSFKVPLGTGPHWSHPVIKDGILYIRHMDALMAYSIAQD